MEVRVLAVAWTCGCLEPSAWITCSQYMTVERRDIVTARWWLFCGLCGRAVAFIM